MSKSLVVNKINELFIVSQSDAEKYADEFIDLVESRGGLLSVDVINNQVPKVFSKSLMWRNGEHEKQSRKTSTKGSYNDFMRTKRIY